MFTAHNRHMAERLSHQRPARYASRDQRTAPCSGRKIALPKLPTNTSSTTQHAAATIHIYSWQSARPSAKPCSLITQQLQKGCEQSGISLIGRNRKSFTVPVTRSNWNRVRRRAAPAASGSYSRSCTSESPAPSRGQVSRLT